jgi:glycosyltransferase involved in cell wall biosynthesis
VVRKQNNEVELSVVIPAHNEQEVIESTIDKVLDVCQRLFTKDTLFEILIIDDGSTDRTAETVKSVAERNAAIVLVSLATNSGHMAAISAGLDLSQGKWVVTMDADGQDPPEKIEEMLRAVKIHEAEICYAIRVNRKADPFRHRMFSPAFYFLLNKLTYGDAKIQAADFRLMSRSVVEVIKRLPERNRIYRVMIPDLKFKSTEVTYVREPRTAGKSKYGLTKLAQLGLKSILATSGASIRLLSLISILTTFSMLILGFWIVVVSSKVNLPPGWASLTALLSLTLLLQSLSTAIVSEILIQINSNLRQRPIYQIKKQNE